jgi:sensor c-di-GMP phosphodiesterase-like protein
MWRPELFCSFNVSAVQIRQPDFVERVVAIVDEYHVDPQTVMLELTETTLVDEGDRATETVTRLREEGFRFAIYRKGFFSDLGKLMGMQDIEVGDPEFDEAFIIKGNDESKVVRFFSGVRRPT